MSRNYDNWERLVAAVVKREQIWKLCHQDSISTISSSDYSCRLEFNLPVWLGSSTRITETFEFLRRLRERNFTTTDLVGLVQEVQLSDQRYHATGTKAVIKSLNSVKITEDQFEQHMIVLGNCSHANVATPWAYYYSEMTKLIVYDYYIEGSVFDMLHGNKSRPNWERRLRIAVGAARGIAHIHTQCGEKLAHGNIKSSNIFLNSQDYGCVSDLEYHASEHELENHYQKSDVYSFGLLLLELLTGKSVQPPYIVKRLQLSHPYAWDLNCFKLDRGTLLADEVDMEVMALEKFPFVDSFLNTSSTVKQELVKTLRVARNCLAELPKHRPTMSRVVLELKNIEDLRHITALSSQHPGEKKQVVLEHKNIEEELRHGTALSPQHPGEKKRVWHRFFPFGR